MMIQRRFRIGAVHALMNAIPTTQTAFDRGWSAADVAHLLDGSLYLDRSLGTADEAELASRIDRLIRYSASTGAEAIIVTGSFFGEAAKQARESVSIPVATSFDGIVERALALDRPLHVLATAPDSVTLLSEELEREAARRSLRLSLSGHAVAGAMDALIGGEVDRHDDLVLEAVRGVDADAVILFAQFSMERILQRSATARGGLVIGPASEGVARLRELIGRR
jgi:Asp/Glu/hydantoin racemase